MSFLSSQRDVQGQAQHLEAAYTVLVRSYPAEMMSVPRSKDDEGSCAGRFEYLWVADDIRRAIEQCRCAARFSNLKLREDMDDGSFCEGPQGNFTNAELMMN